MWEATVWTRAAPVAALCSKGEAAVGAVLGATVVDERQRGAAEWELLWEHARGLWASVLVATVLARAAPAMALCSESEAAVGAVVGAAVVQEQQRGAAEWELRWELRCALDDRPTGQRGRGRRSACWSKQQSVLV